MQITPAAIDALQTTFDGRYQQGYKAAVPQLSALATEVPSSTKSNTYGWMDKIPKLRKWVGERVVQNLVTQQYALANDDYELTLEVPRNDIEDDQLGIYGPLAEMMGNQARIWPDDMLKVILQGGTAATALCHDGQPFFSTSHPIDTSNAGAGTLSNLRAGTALTYANYIAERQRMMEYKGADGEPLAIVPTHLIVPPALEATAKQILESDLIVNAQGINGANGGSQNVMKGTAKVLMMPKLANEVDVWYLADLSQPLKPLVVQIRKAPETISLDQSSNENVFWRKKYVWGVDSRGAAGYALWFLILRAKA